MRNLFFYFVSIFLLSFNNSQNDNGKFNNTIFQDCFSNEEIEDLKGGISSFKKYIVNYYSLNNKNDKEIYLKFLDDFSVDSNIEIEVLNTKKAIILAKEFKSTKAFSFIYDRRSKIEYSYKKIDESQLDSLPTIVLNIDNKDDLVLNDTLENNSIKEINFRDNFIMYRKSKFISCLINKVTNKEILDYLNTIDDHIDLSPSVKASGFASLIREENVDFDEVLMSMITYELFYGLVLDFNNIE